MIGLVLMLGWVVLALTAPVLVDAESLRVTQASGPPLAAPSVDHPLGTDEDGRSLLALIIWGSRVSLLVGLAATVISMVIGTLVGVTAGHFRGRPGGLLDRVTDFFLVIPFLPLAIVLATVLRVRWPTVPQVIAVIVVIGITSWPGTARLVRAQAMAVEGRPYLERARALGGGHWHQIARHVLPNVLPVVFANTTLSVSLAILAETTLSFLGLGDPLRPSWGTVLDGAYSAGAISRGAWWWAIFPGVAVASTVLAFNLCGRATERILDPRLKGRA
ncbi:ABC transporter permease [Micromonospora sp. HNM0581]|nr:ABC transporter permease [Micromonospora sp. HNM0581]